jgi:hypothetical protein
MNQFQDKLQLEEPLMITFDRAELDDQATTVAAY